MKHELCDCGHCRCEHAAGFQGCFACPCPRYTWPGGDCDLPDDHYRATAASAEEHKERYV